MTENAPFQLPLKEYREFKDGTISSDPELDITINTVGTSDVDWIFENGVIPLNINSAIETNSCEIPDSHAELSVNNVIDITENNFRQWVQEDPGDPSGDRDDIVRQMEDNQICYSSTGSYWHGQDAIEVANSYELNGKPVVLGGSLFYELTEEEWQVEGGGTQ